MDKTGFSRRLRHSPQPSRAQLRQRQRRTASVLVMAVLSAAWTVQIARPFDAGMGSATPAGAPSPATVELPDVDPGQPASLASAGGQGPWRLPRRDGAVQPVGQPNRGVPSVAQAAYQRAEAVITSADSTCGVDWELLAAIGQVESDHGRFNDNVLGPDGISRPGVFGQPLDGSRHTQEISDTDGGRFDHDLTWDRAVGPMQFIPATWREVAVDADGDGRRNPQDIDDAALASAVYLCAGEGDLATVGGRRAALLRYNLSRQYGDLVLRIRTVYLKHGAMTELGYSGRVVSALPGSAMPAPSGVRAEGARLRDPAPGVPAPQPPKDPAPAEPAPEKPADNPRRGDPLSSVVGAVDKVVSPALSGLQATIVCAARGLNVLRDATAWARCFEKLTAP